MSQYFTGDWADFTTCSGAACGDWTLRYRTNTPFSPANPVVTPASGASDWTALTWNDVDGDANRGNVELLLKASFSATPRHFAIVRGSGADESATLYSLYAGGTALRVYYCSGTDTPTQVATVARTHTAGVSYWFRFRINGSGPTTVQAKSWSGLITDEPAGWQINTTDSSGPTAAGWVGPSDYNLGGSVTITQFGVGTNGDSAPDTAPSSGATGTLAATETGSDTASFAGDVVVSGTLAASETGSDTAAFAGDVYITGTLAATESGSDTAAFTGTSAVVTTGTLAATETGSDTAAFAGDVLIDGALAATESGSDTAAFAGDVYVTGTLAATESGSDTAAFTGTAAAAISGTLAATESGSDTASFTNVATAPSVSSGGGGGGTDRPAPRRKVLETRYTPKVEAPRGKLFEDSVESAAKELGLAKGTSPQEVAVAAAKEVFKPAPAAAKATITAALSAPEASDDPLDPALIAHNNEFLLLLD